MLGSIHFWSRILSVGEASVPADAFLYVQYNIIAAEIQVWILRGSFIIIILYEKYTSAEHGSL